MELGPMAEMQACTRPRSFLAAWRDGIFRWLIHGRRMGIATDQLVALHIWVRIQAKLVIGQKKMMKQIDLSSSLYILIKTITCESNFFCPILLYGILVLRTKPNWTNLLRWAPEFDLSTNTNMRKFDHKHIELLFIPFNKIPTKQHTMYMDVYGCI